MRSLAWAIVVTSDYFPMPAPRKSRKKLSPSAPRSTTSSSRTRIFSTARWTTSRIAGRSSSFLSMLVCPIVQRYLPVLKRLEAEYRKKDVQFLAVNVGCNDTIVDLAALAIEYDAPFPFVKDTKGKCLDALGVDIRPRSSFSIHNGGFATEAASTINIVRAAISPADPAGLERSPG